MIYVFADYIIRLPRIWPGIWNRTLWKIKIYYLFYIVNIVTADDLETHQQGWNRSLKFEKFDDIDPK